jgi:hypothetical protein
VLIQVVHTRSGSIGRVTFGTHGVPNGRKVSIFRAMREAAAKNRRTATDTRQLNGRLPVGTVKRIEQPANGLAIWRPATISGGGMVLRRTTCCSHDSTIIGIPQAGTGGSKPATTPTPPSAP